MLTGGELYLSDEILAELDEVLRTDPRLARKVPAPLRARYVALLARAAHLVRPSRVSVVVDPGDEAIVGTAIAAKAPLVTGDKALLRDPPEGLRVLSVRLALEEQAKAT